MVNVVPLNDEAPHRHSADCWCDPRGDMYDQPNGPRIIHNSADCRETVERLLGEGLGPDKRWAIYAD